MEKKTTTVPDLDNYDTVGLFKREFDRFPILDPPTLSRKAQLVRQGQKAARRIQEGIDSPELHKAVEEGNQAKKDIVTSHLRWIMKLASSYLGNGVLFSDLTGAAALGLCKGVGGFAAKKRQYQANTYLGGPMRNEIIAEIGRNKGKTGLSPYHFLQRKYIFNKVIDPLTQELKRIPTDDEALERLHSRAKEMLGKPNLGKNEREFYKILANMKKINYLYLTRNGIHFDFSEKDDGYRLNRHFFHEADAPKERRENPFIGLPNEILEKIWDRAGLTEYEREVILLRTTFSQHARQHGGTDAKYSHHFNTGLRKMRKTFGSNLHGLFFMLEELGFDNDQELFEW